MADEKLTFASEDARLAALAELPDEPPPRTSDIDGWKRGVAEQQERIRGAEIVAAPATPTPPAPQAPEPQAPATAPAAVEPPAPAPAPSEPAASAAPADDIVFTAPDGSTVKRSELPPELQKYKNVREMLKSAAHARRYADSSEKVNQMLQNQLQELNKRLADGPRQPEPQRQATPPSQDPQQPLTPPTPRDARRLASVRENIKALRNLDWDSMVQDGAKFNQVKDTVASIGDVIEQLDSVHTGEVSTLRREIDQLKQTVLEVGSRNDETIRSIREQERLQSLNGKFAEFQKERPELQTSKPVFAVDTSKPSVEDDVRRFADSYLVRKTGTPAIGETAEQRWAQRNRVVNAYLRGDPDVVSFCEANGITPDRFGTTPTDLQGYAVAVNVQNMLYGYRVDEATGQKIPLVSQATGEQVKMPDFDTAYEYLCRTAGISDKRRREELREAEIRGQQKLEAAMHTTPAPSIGRDGASPRPATSDKMNPIDAAKIMAGVDEYQMHQAAMRGDRRLFNLVVKCQEAMGIPEENRWKPDVQWPKETVQA